MKIKMKNISHIHHKGNWEKIDLGLDMDTNILNIRNVWGWLWLYCIKQHVSNIWSSLHEKVKLHRGWVDKKRYL